MRIPTLRLRGLPTDEFAVDFGTTHVLIHSRSRGLIINEQSIVAVDSQDGEVLATGNEALELRGRSAAHVEVRYPMREGAIADSDLAQPMLAKLLRKARGGRPRFARRVIYTVASGATAVERRAIRSAVSKAGGHRIYLVDALVAAALGTVDHPDNHRAATVVDIGGGKVSAGVVVDFDVITSHTTRVGGTDFDAAIIDLVRRRHDLVIGEGTAERAKMELGSAVEPAAERSTEVRGQSLLLDRPARAVVTSDEIYEAIAPLLRRLVATARSVLSQLPPEAAADVAESGIVLTGGGALLAGMVERLTGELGVKCTIADSPRESVVRGAARLFDYPLLLRRVDRRAREGE